MKQIKCLSERVTHLRPAHSPNGKPKALPSPGKDRNTATPPLAQSSNILGLFENAVDASGLVGLAKAAKLIYLALVTRFFQNPVSVVLKGPSSAGKSFAVKQVLRFFPSEAFYVLSSMSERALAYLDVSLEHRFLIIYETAGLGEIANYFVRSLLSEGYIRHQTVEQTKQGFKSRLLEKAGPTGLILTTTAVNLHGENETRLFSVPIADDPEQTRRILLSQARSNSESLLDSSAWHDLQTWLSSQEHRVHIPNVETLARAVSPIAVRLRRDFPALLCLIRAHALLHQANRTRTREGLIVADFEDYSVVRDLVSDLISEGVESTVSSTIRETVNAVTELREEMSAADSIGVSTVARHLKIDRSSASRRIAVAIERGHLKNLETTKKGKQYDLVVDDPLPDDVQILPTAEALAECCSVARSSRNGSYLDQAAAYVNGDIDKPPIPENSNSERRRQLSGVGTADFEEQWRDPDAEDPF